MSASDNHGSTAAAWTVVVIITIAFTVGTLAVILGNWPMFWVGVGLVGVGGLYGLIAKRIGADKH
jgi:hypothetical protein